MILRAYYLLVLMIMVCNASKAQVSGDTVQTMDKIRALLDAQCEAWNNGDIYGYMEGYWHSDSLLFTSGGKIERGWAATLEKYKKTYNSRSKMGKLNFSNLQYSIMGENGAWIFGNWQLERENDSPRGVFTLILQKFNSGWKIIHDHTSSEQK